MTANLAAVWRRHSDIDVHPAAETQTWICGSCGAPSSAVAAEKCPTCLAARHPVPAHAPAPAPAFSFGAPAAPCIASAAPPPRALAFSFGPSAVAASAAAVPLTVTVVTAAAPAAVPPHAQSKASNAPRDFFKASSMVPTTPAWPSASDAFSLLAGPPVSSFEQFDAIAPSPASASSPLSFVFTCGSGECEQLGHGDDIYTLEVPRLVLSLARIAIVRVAVGGLHTLALTARGEVWSWGCNDDCALGRGGAESRPGRVRGLLDGRAVAHIACGDSHSIALDAEGRVFAWGTYKGADGYLGFDSTTKKQAQPRWLSDVWTQFGPARQVSCGADHSGIVTARGQAIVWGYNGQGQLGKPFVERAMRGGRQALLQLVPHPVHVVKCRKERVDALLATGPEPEAEAAALPSVAAHGPAAKKRGRGAGASGAVSESPATSSAPLLPQLAPGRGTPKKGDEAVLRVFCVGYSTFILVEGTGASASTSSSSGNGSGERLFACGLNSYGQLGLGHCADVAAPKEVEALRGLGVAQMAGGSQHCLALTRGGLVFAFGRGDSGQLGLGVGSALAAATDAGTGAGAGNGERERHGAISVGASAFFPVQVAPARLGGSAALQVAANGSTSACVTARGDLFTWGFGESGQLGNAGAGDENLPFLVNRGPTSSSSASSGGELSNMRVRAVGLGGQHLVALGGPREGGALPSGLVPSTDASCEVVEDPAVQADDDEQGDEDKDEVVEESTSKRARAW